MRLPWTRWQTTLNKLGLKIVWGKRSQTPRKVPTRHSQLEKLEGREMMASQINNLHFINDTGTVGDGQSSDIRIGGNVSFTGSYMGQTLKVEFDHNNDGNIDGYVNASYMGTPFEYNPRTADSSLNTFTGSLPMRVRVEELDSMGQSLSVGSWISFPITVLAPEPEIDVQDPGPYGMSNTSLPDNTGSVSFGTTAQGTSVNKTLNIKNLGQGPLNVNLSSFSLPAGFTLVTPPSSTIAAGSYSSFVIRMDATSPGSPSGVMTFTSNDSDEATYHISLSGTVTGLSFSVNNLQLVTDNGYSSTDKVTSVPTVTGSVSYTGSYSGGTIRVEFDHNNDGVMEGYVNASPSMPFQYDPRNAQPSLSTYNGTFTLRYRVVVLDMMSQPTYTGSWGSFVMTLENNSQPVLDVQDASNSTSIANNTGSVSFGTVNQGTSVTKSFTIRNTGGATMTVNVGSFSLPAGFVLATSPSSTVAANGGTTTFSVRMDGTTAGSKSGRLTFTTNSTTATYDIGLSGTVNALSFSVNNLTLINDTWINGDYITSDPRVTGTVTQTGSFSGSRIDVEFDHNSDGVKEGAVTYVSTGMSWQYDPRSVQPSLSSYSGNFPLRYRVVAYDTMSQVVYTGSWASFPITLDNTPQPEIEVLDSGAMSLTSGSGSVYFGSTTQGTPLTKTFTIRNTGPGALTINTSSFSLPSGYSLVTPPASTVNANGGTTTFTVQLNAVDAGSPAGQITFSNTDADEGTFSFSVSGTVNSSLARADVRDSNGTSIAVNGTYTVGSATVGTTLSRTLTIWNTGSQNLTLQSPVLSGSSAFSISSAPQLSVMPGSSTSFTVQFNPSLAGNIQGAITIATNDPTKSSYVVNLSATGVAAASAITIADLHLVLDTGASSTDRDTWDTRLRGTIPLDANIGTGHVEIEFDHNGDGVREGYASATAAGQEFNYDPRTADPALATYTGPLALRFRTVLYNATNQPLATSNWTGFGITLQIPPAAKVEVNQTGGAPIQDHIASVDFGATTIGTAVNKSFTVRNSGTTDLNIDLNSIQVPAGFTLVTPPAAVVAPNTETTFVVRMNATVAGLPSGILSFDSNDPNISNFDFRIHGDVYDNNPLLEVLGPSGQQLNSGATVDLGTTEVGQPITKTFTIFNSGGMPLTLDPNLLQTTAGLTVVSGFDTTVAPYGGVTHFTVRFEATSAASVAGTITFPSNDPLHSTFSLTWLAAATPPLPSEEAIRVWGIRLAYDSGASDVDRISYDGRIAGSLAGNVTAGTVEVQFDHNNDGTADGFTAVSSGKNFSYDPSQTNPALATFLGDVHLKYRSVLKNASGEVVRTTAWASFDYTLVARPEIPNLQIVRMGLMQDTLTNDADRITTNPTMSGMVRGTAGTGTIRVEFDHNADGVMDGYVKVAPDTTFHYDPRRVDPTLWKYVGNLTLNYRLAKFDASGNREATGAWDSFAMTLVAPPISQLVVDSFGLVKDDLVSNSDLISSDPTLKAMYRGFAYDTNANISMEIDTNGDGVPEDDTTNLVAGQGYTYLPALTQYGTKTIQVRFNEWAPSLGTYLFGPWASLTFTYAAAAAGTITDLQLTNDTGSSATDRISRDVTFQGKLTGDVVAFQTIHVDFNGDGQDDQVAYTDANGGFQVIPKNLPNGLTTARVRGSRFDHILQSEVLGEWTTFAFTKEGTPLPVLGSLALVSDTGSSSTDRITTNATITGKVTDSGPVSGITIEFDRDGAGVVVARAQTDGMGSFQYLPLQLAFGSHTIRGRVAIAEADGSISRGPWESITFTLEDSVFTPLAIQGLGLAHDTGTGAAASDGVTSDPAISGTVGSGVASNGVSYGVIVELDRNGDGVADQKVMADAQGKFLVVPLGLAFGPQTVQVRSKQWDPIHQVGAFSSWQPFSFTYVETVNQRPVVTSLGLLADTGTSQSDLVSGNSTVVGQITNDGSVDRMAIEIDTNGDGVAEGLAYTDSTGKFVYSPTALAFGTQTIRARAIEHVEKLATYVASEWQTLTFQYQDGPNEVAKIVEFQLANTNAATSDGLPPPPQFTGRIVNEKSLSGITVEFDWNNDGNVDATATTDANGSFNVTMPANPTAATTVRARALEMNMATGQQMRSGWSSLAISPNATANALPVLSQLALKTVTSGGTSTTDPTIQGTVTNDNGVAGLTAEYDINNDGLIDGTALTDSQGKFVFTPTGLTAGSVQIKVRIKEADSRGLTQTSAWQTLSFTYIDSASLVMHVENLRLANDTGNSSTDNATSDPTIRGQVVLGTAATRVEYDLNGDGIADGSTSVDSQGNFEIVPVGLSEGYRTISVRPVDPSVTRWQNINFVNSSQPDGTEAQTLVTTYQSFNNQWATAQSTYQTSLASISTTYKQAQQNAQATYQATLLSATGAHDAVVTAARATYASAMSAAQQTYNAALSAASAQFTTDLANFSGDTTSFEPIKFEWGPVPIDNGPAFEQDDSDNPLPPMSDVANPDMTYDLGLDRAYQAEMARIEQEYQGRLADNYQVWTNSIHSSDGTYSAAVQAINLEFQKKYAEFEENFKRSIMPVDMSGGTLPTTGFTGTGADDEEVSANGSSASGTTDPNAKPDVAKARQKLNSSLSAFLDTFNSAVKAVTDAYNKEWTDTEKKTLEQKLIDLPIESQGRVTQLELEKNQLVAQKMNLESENASLQTQIAQYSPMIPGSKTPAELQAEIDANNVLIADKVTKIDEKTEAIRLEKIDGEKKVAGVRKEIAEKQSAASEKLAKDKAKATQDWNDKVANALMAMGKVANAMTAWVEKAKIDANAAKLKAQSDAELAREKGEADALKIKVDNDNAAEEFKAQSDAYAAVEKWLAQQKARRDALARLDAELNTPVSNYQKSLAVNQVVFSESLASLMHDRNSNDITSEFKQLKDDNASTITLAKDALELRNTQRKDAIDAAAVFAKDGVAQEQAEADGRLEAVNQFSKDLNKANRDRDDRGAEITRKYADKKAGHAYDQAVADAESRYKKGGNPNLQADLDQHQKDYDIATIVNDVEDMRKETATSMKTWGVDRANARATKEESFTWASVTAANDSVESFRGLQEALADHQATFAKAFAAKYQATLKAYAAHITTSAIEQNGHGQAFSNGQSDVQKIKNESDATSQSYLELAIANKSKDQIAEWNNQLGTRWSEYQYDLAFGEVARITEYNAAQIKLLTALGPYLVMYTRLYNSLVNSYANGKSNIAKAKLEDDADAVKKYGNDAADAYKTYAYDVAYAASARDTTYNNNTQNVADVINEHQRLRDENVAEAGREQDNKLAEAEKSFNLKRVNALFDLQHAIITSEAFDSLLLAAAAEQRESDDTAKFEYKMKVGLEEVKRVSDDTATEVQWARIVADNDASFPRNAKIAREKLEGTMKSLNQELGDSAVEAILKYQKAIADAEYSFAIPDATALADQVEYQNGSNNEFSKDSTKLENNDRERKSEALNKYRRGKAEDRVKALGGDPLLVVPPVNGAGISASTIASPNATSTNQISIPTAPVNGTPAFTVVPISSELQREKAYQLAVAAADLLYIRSYSQAQTSYEQAVSDATESVAYYSSNDRRNQSVLYATSTATNSHQLAYALANRQATRDHALVSNSAQTTKAINMLQEDLRIAQGDADANYAKAMADTRAVQIASIVSAESNSYSTVVTSNGTGQGTSQITALRTAKESAAETFLSSEFNHAKANQQGYADAASQYAASLKVIRVGDAQTQGSLYTIHAQESKLDTDAAAEALLPIELQNHVAVRTYRRAEQDFDLAQIRNTSNSLAIAETTFVHAAGTARIDRSKYIGVSVGDMLAAKSEEQVSIAHSAYDAFATTSKAALYAIASAVAQSEWIEAMQPAYVTYMVSIGNSQLNNIESLAVARASQAAAGRSGEDIFQAATRPIYDAADDQAFQAKLQKELAVGKSQRQAKVEEIAAFAGYNIARVSADASLNLVEVAASGTKDVAKVAKQSQLPHAYDQLLDYSKDFEGGGLTLDIGITPGGNTPYTTTVPQSNGGSVTPEKQEEIDVVAGRLVYGTAVGQANVAHETAIANSTQTQQRSIASAQRALDSTLAAINRGLRQAVVPHMATRDLADLQAELTRSLAEVQVNGTARLDEANARSAWRASDLTAQSAAASQVAQTMQLPWADYQAHKAAAELDWWVTSGSPLVLQKVVAEKSADLVHQTNLNGIMSTWRQSLIASRGQEETLIAYSDYTLAVDEALSNEAFEFTRSAAESARRIAKETARSADLVSHYMQQSTAVNATISLTGILAADDGRTYNSTINAIAADVAYHLAVTAAEDIAATVQQGLVQAHYQQTSTLLISNSSIEEDTDNSYIIALTTAQLAYKKAINAILVGHEAALASTHALSFHELYQTNPSPWATYDAAVEQANGELVSTNGPIRTSLRDAENDAQKQFDVVNASALSGMVNAYDQAKNIYSNAGIDARTNAGMVSHRWLTLNPATNLLSELDSSEIDRTGGSLQVASDRGKFSIEDHPASNGSGVVTSEGSPSVGKSDKSTAKNAEVPKLGIGTEIDSGTMQQMIANGEAFLIGSDYVIPAVINGRFLILIFNVKEINRFHTGMALAPLAPQVPLYDYNVLVLNKIIDPGFQNEEYISEYNKTREPKDRMRTLAELLAHFRDKNKLNNQLNWKQSTGDLDALVFTLEVLPITGTAASLLDAREASPGGDTVWATGKFVLNFAGDVTLVGGIYGSATKVAGKCDKVIGTMMKVEAAIDGLQAAVNVTEALASGDRNQIGLTGGLVLLQLFGGAAARKLAMDPGACFVAGTPVECESGQKPIESIQVGEKVWAYNFQDGEWTLQPVLQTHETPFGGNLVEIAIDGFGEEITATAGHLFWVVRGSDLESRPNYSDEPGSTKLMYDDRGLSLPGRWVASNDLQIDDELALLQGAIGVVRAVRIAPAASPKILVYNLSVQNHSSYAVGEFGALVHNNGLCHKLKEAVDAGRAAAEEAKSQSLFRAMSEKEFDRVTAANGLVIRGDGSHELGVALDPGYLEDLASRKTGKGRKWAVKVELEVEDETWEILKRQSAVNKGSAHLFPDHPVFEKGMRVPQLKIEKRGVEAILLGESPEAVGFLNSRIITIRRIE